MVILYVIELVLFAMVCVVLVTQVVVPLFVGRPILPMLHRKAQAEARLEDAEEDLDTVEVENEAKRLERLVHIRRDAAPPEVQK